MITPEVLGRRIKNFRVRANFTQLELESEADLSPGAVSRIEAGKVSPLITTVEKISKVLNLTERERDYMIGWFSIPANDEEILSASEQVKNYFAERATIAYLIDDRWRVLDISQSFAKVLNIQKEIDRVRGKTVIEFILDRDLHVRDFIDESSFGKIVQTQLIYYFHENSFMLDDEIYLRTQSVIMRDPLASKIWRDIKKNVNIIDHNIKQDQSVKLKLYGRTIPMRYTRENLVNSKRFRVIDYEPESRFLRFIQSLISKL